MPSWGAWTNVASAAPPDAAVAARGDRRRLWASIHVEGASRILRSEASGPGIKIDMGIWRHCILQQKHETEKHTRAGSPFSTPMLLDQGKHPTTDPLQRESPTNSPVAPFRAQLSSAITVAVTVAVTVTLALSFIYLFIYLFSLATITLWVRRHPSRRRR